MARQRRQHHKSIGEDFLRWLGFSVLFSLFPLAAHFVYLRTGVPLSTDLWSTLRSTLARGDLLLITCCVGGAALGERMGRIPIRPRTEMFLGLTCLTSTVASVFFYALTFGGRLRNTGVVATLSCVLFIMTVFTSAAIMFITLQERHRR